MGKFINGEFIPQWKLDGKRRPFPGICEAAKRWGFENVYFRKPQYVPDGHCPWCGKAVENKRRTYCSDECRQNFQNATVWNRGRDAYSTQILYRDNFTCQNPDCGEFHAFMNEHGIYVPCSDGNLEVDHILPVSCCGGDEPSNLRTLCSDCHKKRHKKKQDPANNFVEQ